MEQRSLGQIAGRIRNGKCVLLIGAGCSVTSGIPTADGFIKLIEEQFPEDLEDLTDTERQDYAICMAKLGPAHRRHLIQQQVMGKPVNLAHLAIASLIQHEKIDRIISTNFDALLVRACSLLGVETAIYDVDALSNIGFRALDIGLPAVFYVHGQYYGFTQNNAPEDYAASHASMLSKLIERISETHTWIVVGYSGLNDPSAEPLLNQHRFDCELFWVGFKDEPPCPRIQNELLLPSKHAFWVPGYDADTFFAALARYSQCDPVSLFRRPFTHLRNLFQGVKMEDGTEESHDRANSLFRIQQAIRQLEAGGPESSWRKQDALLVPDPHLGLIFTLPPFRPGGYSSAAEMVAAVETPDFRLRAFQTNWGPPIVAIEHHLAKLQHCWILCTLQVQRDYEFARQIIAALAPTVECHPVTIENPHSILEVQEAVKKIYATAFQIANLAPSDLIADITGGLSTITGGIVLATLDDDRPIEYLTQGIPLQRDGKALTVEEIRERRVLLAIRTNGEMVGDSLLRAS